MHRIRLRVRYHHGMIPRGVLALSPLVAGLLATLTLSRAFATTPGSLPAPAVTSGMRQFYLSRSSALGNDADRICAAGYHFASMWEIADPSNLVYNTSLGMTSLDSGAGPPSQLIVRPSITPITASGWVRTGYGSSGAAVAGQGNCYVWSTSSGSDSGTAVHLVSDWTGGDQDVGPWNAEVRGCDDLTRVWCVQDHGFLPVFLPVVIKG